MSNIKIINKDLKDGPKLQKIAAAIFDKVAKIFGVKDLPNISIFFHSSRESYEKSVGHSTQMWEVGNASNGNRIDIIHPDYFEEISSHKNSEFDQILTHEIVHIFIGTIAPDRAIPFWLNEGLSMYIAGQLERYRHSRSLYLEDKFSRHLATQAEWDKRANYDAYKIACLFTAFLIEKFSMNKIVELLKLCDKNYFEIIFDGKILKVLGSPISELEAQFVDELNK